jgi:hypothetical protein
MDADSIWIVAFLVGIVGGGLVILIIWAVASSARTKKQAGIRQKYRTPWLVRVASSCQCR